MTQFVVDVSRHQVERSNPLDLARARAAGFTVANIQLDRGRQADLLPAWAVEYAIEARRLGMGVSTYRWLDNRLGGRASAEVAFDRLQRIGLERVAHTVDCEANATEQHLRDYVTTMTRLLGRPVAVYSGRWWLSPRGWQVADLSPFLWSAPSVGYLPAYPGDDSRHWDVAAYGGWSQLSVMQYMVAPLPGTGDCSLSAIRDPRVWAALTGGGSVAALARNMQAFSNDFKRAEPGATVWGIGDEDHRDSPSDHNPDDTPGSLPEQTDADNDPEIRGVDIPLLGPVTMPKLRVYRQRLTGRAANRARMKYVILEQTIWRRNGGWVPEVYTGDYHGHLHVSGWVGDDENGSPWDIGPDVAPIPEPLRKDNGMFLIHRMTPVVTYALVGEQTWLEWKATDVITTPVGSILGTELATGYAKAVGNSAEETPAQWEAIKARVGVPAEVEVDAAAVAAALAADPALLAAIAKSVNDNAHARLAE